MNCPKCNKPLKEGAKFCVYCGERVAPAAPAAENVPSEPASSAPAATEAEAAAATPHAADLGQDAGRHIYWEVQPGQVARVIHDRDLGNFKDVRGVVISEGTTAYIRANGRTFCAMEGGSYEFSTKKADPYASTSTSPIKRAWNIVTGLFRSAPHPDTDTEKALYELAKQDCSFSIVILVDKAFPLLVGAKQATLDDYKTFQPMRIRTALLDLEVGVNAYFQIADKDLFIRHWLTERKEVTTMQIVDELSDIVRARIQERLGDASWEGEKVPDELRRQLKDELNEDATRTYFGLRIARIVEITAVSKDLDRFRQLSSEMYLSERELDYLRRTNDFKNRLAEVQNAQQLHEARTNLDLQRELDAINKDNLLRQDELDKFVLLLESERRLREARTKEEEDAALAEIRKTGLMREIDYRRIEQDADLERRRKEADFAYEQQQREADMKARQRQQQFEQFMAMEQASNQHELEMVRARGELDSQWRERLSQQQQAQNDQMMSLLHEMATGKRAAVPQQAPANANGATKFCTECGAKIPAGSKHCPECGAKQN